MVGVSQTFVHTDFAAYLSLICPHYQPLGLQRCINCNWLMTPLNPTPIIMAANVTMKVAAYQSYGYSVGNKYHAMRLVMNVNTKVISKAEILNFIYINFGHGLPLTVRYKCSVCVRPGA